MPLHAGTKASVKRRQSDRWRSIRRGACVTVHIFLFVAALGMNTFLSYGRWPKYGSAHDSRGASTSFVLKSIQDSTNACVHRSHRFKHALPAHLPAPTGSSRGWSSSRCQNDHVAVGSPPCPAAWCQRVPCLPGAPHTAQWRWTRTRLPQASPASAPARRPTHS